MSSQFNDTEDDTPLYTRRAVDARGADRRADEVTEPRHPDREVTLNTGIVLALFFALALLCAVFFGFGYSIGHKSVPPVVAADTDPAPVDSTAKAGTKPSPGSAAPQPVPEYVPAAGTERATPKVAAPVAPATVPPRGLPDAAPVHTAAPVVRSPQPVTAVSATTTASAVANSPAPAGSSFVQIAAVSHQEDADVLLSALRRRGYTVLTRSEAADKLIHVQIGPFSNRKEADAMRQKLAGDGYNAFIK